LVNDPCHAAGNKICVRESGYRYEPTDYNQNFGGAENFERVFLHGAGREHGKNGHGQPGDGYHHIHLLHCEI
jgi:hypothetical protein